MAGASNWEYRLTGRSVARWWLRLGATSAVVFAANGCATATIAGPSRITFSAADAALLDLYDADSAAPAALTRLVRESFETAGNRGTSNQRP